MWECSRAKIHELSVFCAKVSDKAAMEALNLRPKEVGTLLMRVFADMAFQRGCVHAGTVHPDACFWRT